MHLARITKRLLTSSAFLALTAPLAFAQTPASAPTQASAEEIVVTGTRIKSAASQAPQPIQMLSAAELAQRGQTSVADALDKIPALQASNNVEQSLRDGAVTGRVALDLRGLGSARTLVLVNGRRHVAGSPGSAAVDVSTIPSGMIERVDVLTGGASAIYGSDAVTGVVNFVLKENFEGQQLDMQFGASGQGDSESLFASYLAGANFDGGKGNITFGVQIDDRSGILYSDRDRFAGNKVPITDEISNPALRFQNGDPLPAGQSALNVVGRTILTTAGTPRFANTPQALIDRAKSASPLAFGQGSVFAISANQGLIGLDPYGFLFAASAGELAGPADVNNNGINDCRESAIGRGLPGFVPGCWVIDRKTGRLRPFQDGVIADGIYQFGGDGAEQSTDGDSLTPDTRSFAVNLNANYEFSKSFRVYTELKAVENRGKEFNYYNTFDDTLSFRTDNPFIPADLRALINQEIAAQLAADPTYDPSTFLVTMARDHVDIFDPTVRNTRRTYRGVIGAEGEITPNWSYDVSVNYGRTEQSVFGANRLRDRFFAAADATVDAQGRPACRISVTGEQPIASFLDPDAFSPVPAQSYAPSECVPLNLFGLNKASEAAKAFQRYIARSEALIEQTVVQGVITGDTGAFFSLPGGPIGLAFGGEYREEKSDFQPDIVNRNGNGFERRTTAPVTGQFDVKEAFVEVNLPILADAPFAKVLNVGAAYRAGDYSTVGSTSSYKIDGVWAPVSDIRIRGGVSQTVRAPNIVELFLAPQSVNSNPRDPCLSTNIGLGPAPANRLANCSTALGLDLATTPFTNRRTAQFAGTRVGNPTLQEETSDSWTAGVVLAPRFLPGLTATVDYWNIKIDNAISVITQDEIVANCYDAATLNNQYCALFARNLSVPKTSGQYGLINAITVKELNFARLEASGIDFDVAYSFALDDVGLANGGDVRLGVAGTYLEKRDDFPFAAEPNRANPAKLELNFPEWAYTVSAEWTAGAFSLGWFANYQSEQALRSVEIESVSDWTPNTAPATWVHDLSLTWTSKDSLKVIAGVNNVLDEEPFFTETSIPVSAVGRSFFVRLSSSF
ncbi:MAG: TonB-dependent receptor [Alphaproteobacteria bacterium]|nr:TonB-dependent receptor [Alphaproteobacteria bacterium]